MTGITRDELMQMAREAGLIDFYNAILERAAVECEKQKRSHDLYIDQTAFVKDQEDSACAGAVRALKINTGD